MGKLRRTAEDRKRIVRIFILLLPLIPTVGIALAGCPC